MYDGAAVQSAVALHIWTVWATCLSRYMVCAGCGAPRHWLDLLACKAYANCFAGCSACPQFRGVDQATETAVAPAATPSHCCGLYLWGGCREARTLGTVLAGVCSNSRRTDWFCWPAELHDTRVVCIPCMWQCSVVQQHRNHSQEARTAAHGLCVAILLAACWQLCVTCMCAFNTASTRSATALPVCRCSPACIVPHKHGLHFL